MFVVAECRIVRGMTFAGIGKHLGISRQRAHQIYNEYISLEPAATRKSDTHG